ncbi:bifunctional adenosylcobinamide kinase/adenosylcobinamide-phosphate guanylyltransferase [Actomonas aquatica]|uniref:Adenosylcobinamide kinase n=1 Tax=Actomonas aquatica TaxID=2866162 RepID=A0ABZ1CEJ9_9BACT|nr:bifunctional adenosylcobinamide kinase/adenosylcobinamide-phosphate guanylyltransferase [Opitutus sp. WL0086]WRQ89722.1 bifunctional adenosylcobinamide kinase/adenosylcobinamide-phosphate guanylyltransferase [Opitutus sp. WL0086]
MSDLIYLTGPVRSGKSSRAVELAKGWGDDVVFVATYRDSGDDDEMAARLARHRAERPASWRTLEAPRDVVAELAALDPGPSGVVLDCATLWLGDRFERGDEEILAEWSALLAAARAAPWPMVIVGNEIGWAPVPENPAVRRFRDLAGWMGQRAAAAATEAWLMVSGCAVPLKGRTLS